MKKFLTILIIAVASGLTGCYYVGPCIDGSGPVVSEFREISVFNGVHNTGSFEVFVTRAEEYTVEIAAQESLLPIIETYVSGGTLIVKTRNGTCYRSGSPVEVYVTLPELEYLRLSGSGKLEADVVSGSQVECSNSGSGYLRIDTAYASRLEAANSGSGSVQLEEIYADEASLINSGSGTVNGGTLFDPAELIIRHSSSGRVRGSVVDGITVDAALSGSGRINLEGNAQVAEFRLNSSGRIDALDLRVADVTATATGSGNIYMYATEFLDATITGSGDIIYRGDPAITVRITGSGRLRSY